MCYDFCKVCGAPHDDGTADLCFNCLEKKEALADRRELSDLKCSDCGSDHLTELVPGVSDELLCLGCGRIYFSSDLGYPNRLAHCNNCDYSFSFDDSPDSFFCGCDKSDNYELLVAESDHQLRSPCLYHKWYEGALLKGLSF